MDASTRALRCRCTLPLAGSGTPNDSGRGRQRGTGIFGDLGGIVQGSWERWISVRACVCVLGGVQS
eukprot:5803515-Pleurochrysis_carterae.AAC.3